MNAPFVQHTCGRLHAGIVCLAFLALLAAFTPHASAVTAADADRIFAAYNKAFYHTAGTNGWYHHTTEGGKSFFWNSAEELEMVLDVFERTKDPACLTIYSNLVNGFITDHGKLWSSNEFNDDILWMVIACARGYQHTRNPALLDLARSNFELTYARAWSTNLGGGLWWKTSNHSKNACVNGPGAIAACLLYQIEGRSNDLVRAESIYQWERATLFNTNTGAVYDNIRASGRLGRFSLTYNQGTFIGAANLLGHTNDARLAADYTMDHLCQDGVLPGYKNGDDGGGFNGIFVRWLAKYMNQRGEQDRYQAWLQANANAAWSHRRTNDDLSWSYWGIQTPSGEIESWGCSSAVVVMQVGL